MGNFKPPTFAVSALWHRKKVELQLDIQLKKKIGSQLFSRFLDSLTSLHNHAIFMSALFGSIHISEQILQG